MNKYLPDGWIWGSPLDISGLTPNALTIGPFGSDLKVTDYRDSGIPLVFVREIRSKQFGGKGTKFLDSTKAATLARHCVRSGDVLITKMGDPPGDVALYPESRPPAIITADCIKLTTNSDIATARYIFHCLQSEVVKNQILERSAGIAQQKISLERFKTIKIPLAPLPEQTRIADKLDTVLARVGACRDRLARVSPLLKRFRQSVLAAATSGRLTEEWRDADRPYSLCTLGDLISEGLRNGRSVKDGSGPRVLRLSALKKGNIDLTECKSGDWGGIDARGYFIRSGDFLVSRGNGSRELVGRGGLVSEITEELAYPDTMIRVRLRVEVLLPSYLRLVWDSGFVRAQIEVKAKTTAGIWKISQGDLEAIKLPVPTPEEQTEIVRRVETLFAFADRLEARLTQAQAAAERLTPALLAKAFRGELVPQDPDDEPAAELLKRLAAQRDAAPAKKKTRRAATSARA